MLLLFVDLVAHVFRFFFVGWLGGGLCSQISENLDWGWQEGRGVWEKGSIDRTINRVLMTLAEKNFGHRNGPIFSTKHMSNDDFSEPPRRADSKNPVFFFFSELWVWVTSGGQGQSR